MYRKGVIGYLLEHNTVFPDQFVARFHVIQEFEGRLFYNIEVLRLKTNVELNSYRKQKKVRYYEWLSINTYFLGATFKQCSASISKSRTLS